MTQQDLEHTAPVDQLDQHQPAQTGGGYDGGQTLSGTAFAGHARAASGQRLALAAEDARPPTIDEIAAAEAERAAQADTIEAAQSQEAAEAAAASDPVAPPATEGDGRHRGGRVTSTQFLEGRRRHLPPAEATWGWRGRIHRWSGGAVKPKQSRAEAEHLAARALIQRSFGGPRTIAVINNKGGAAKTTASLMTAYTFGTVRGGGVAAWDNNETRGTLGVRGLEAGHRNTARELLDALPHFADIERSRVGDLAAFMRSQGEAHFDLLASDERHAVTGMIDAADVRAIRAVLQRFYRLLVVDTGNNMSAPNWLEAVTGADHLLIPTTIREDTGFTGLWMLDAMESGGAPADWIESHSTAVLVDPSPGVDKTLTAELTAAYASRCANVLRVPFDPHLVAGGRIDYTALSERTRESWLRVGAAIADRL